jgi:DDE superfamily endonuclease
MAPLRGWGPCGQRLEASAPCGHWKTMTFIAALRFDQISAPWIIDGPSTANSSLSMPRRCWHQLWQRAGWSSSITSAGHKGKPARDVIRATGAHLLLLPPYSPDLNPIEQVFAKIKHLIRAAERRRANSSFPASRTSWASPGPNPCPPDEPTSSSWVDFWHHLFNRRSGE